MSHVWISHATRMNESCHTYEWIMSRVWMRCVCTAYACKVRNAPVFESPAWMSHVTRMNESCHTYEWVMAHKWISAVFVFESYIWRNHVTHMKESRHTYEWVMSHTWMSRCPCAQSVCVTWLIHVRDASFIWYTCTICVSWLIHSCDTTHSYVWHDSFT